MFSWVCRHKAINVSYPFSHNLIFDEVMTFPLKYRHFLHFMKKRFSISFFIYWLRFSLTYNFLWLLNICHLFLQIEFPILVFISILHHSIAASGNPDNPRGIPPLNKSDGGMTIKISYKSKTSIMNTHNEGKRLYLNIR